MNENLSKIHEQIEEIESQIELLETQILEIASQDEGYWQYQELFWYYALQKLDRQILSVKTFHNAYEHQKELLLMSSMSYQEMMDELALSRVLLQHYDALGG